MDRRTVTQYYSYLERFRNRPWANVQLTKAERKGKTPTEIDELRKIKWGRDEGGAPATVIDTSVKDCSQEDK